MDRFKDITTLLIVPYLAVCGGMYHLAYWDTFTLNGLELISISNILKSSISPLFYGPYLSFLLSFIAVTYITAFYPIKLEIISFDENHKPTKKVFGFLYALVFIIPIMLNVIALLPINIYLKWLIWGIIMIIPLVLIDENFFEKFIPNAIIRRTLSNIILSFPFFCYAVGKINSEKILNNTSYKYTIVNETLHQQENSLAKGDTLKFLGFTDEKIIFTDIHNSKTMFFELGNSNVLYLYNKK